MKSTSNAESTAVTNYQQAAPPAAVLAGLKEHAGKGVSQSAEDNLVPLVYILQAQSPQALKRNPAYLEGAEAGSIWLRNANEPIVDGEEGVWFQPCYFKRDIVEWVPRDNGGGFVARHEFLPEELGLGEQGGAMRRAAKRLGAEAREDDQNPNRVRYMLPNGNELVDTRNHIGYICHLSHGEDGSYQEVAPPTPYVIALSSTGHTFSRMWMGQFNQKFIPGSREPAPSWGCLYLLKTGLKKNAAGEWYMWEVAGWHWVQSAVEVERGAALHEAFERGEKQVGAAEDIGEGGSQAGAATAERVAEAAAHI